MRPTLLSLLHQLHESRNPRVILGLRMQDPIPEWISHIAVVSGGRVQAGPKQDIEVVIESNKQQDRQTNTLGSNAKAAFKEPPQVLVDMRNVNVKYHDRHVIISYISSSLLCSTWSYRSSKISAGLSRPVTDGISKEQMVSHLVVFPSIVSTFVNL